MKSLNLILAFLVLFFMNSTVSAENNIYSLGLTKVENVKYLGNRMFSFELRKESSKNDHPREDLFRGNETISFTFNADELNGIIVIIEKKLRKDITLTGKNFVNLLLEKVKNNESINLTCEIKPQYASEASERKPFELTYFQVSEYKNQ